MGHATDLRYAEFHTGLVTTEIIANQLALPTLQKVAGVLTGSAGTEVVKDCRCSTELTGVVGPDIGAMGFLRARDEHMNRHFVGVDDLLPNTTSRSPSNKGCNCTPLMPAHWARLERRMAKQARAKIDS